MTMQGVIKQSKGRVFWWTPEFVSAKQFKVKKKILESVGSLTYRGIGENDGKFETIKQSSVSYVP